MERFGPSWTLSAFSEPSNVLNRDAFWRLMRNLGYCGNPVWVGIREYLVFQSNYVNNLSQPDSSNSYLYLLLKEAVKYPHGCLLLLSWITLAPEPIFPCFLKLVLQHPSGYPSVPLFERIKFWRLESVVVTLKYREIGKTVSVGDENSIVCGHYMSQKFGGGEDGRMCKEGCKDVCVLRIIQDVSEEVRKQ